MKDRFWASWQCWAMAVTAAIYVIVPAQVSAIVPRREPAIARDTDDLDLEPLTRGNNQFALDLYHQLNQEGDGNLLFSPYSLSTVLGMTSAGSRGETALQMARVLNFPWQDDRLHAGFGELQDQIENSEDPDTQIDIANRIWLQKGYDCLMTFIEVTRSHYNAEPATLNFTEDAEGSRQRINRWVSERTQGKIDELIPDGALDEYTRFVLTNAIYFKASWFDPFDSEHTTPEPFEIAPGQTVVVPMMKDNIEADYADLEILHAVQLWYADARLSTIVLFPKEGYQLADIETELTLENLYFWLSSLYYHEGGIHLWLPKFRMEADFEMSEVLSEMGMTDAFSPRSNFSGIDGTMDLVITQVLHSTFIDVNEMGTEAAGATAVGGATRGQPIPLYLQVDRPFIFLIWDEDTQSILFMGRLVDPR